MRVLVIFLLIFHPFAHQSKAARFDQIDMSAGLSQNIVFSLKMDTKGYLWVGTLNGLNRYNGKDFEVFKPFGDAKGYIVGTSVTCLQADIDGNMWVVTSNGGVNYYNSQTNRFEYYPNELFGSFNTKFVRNILKLNDSTLLLTTPDKLGALQLNTLSFIQTNAFPQAINLIKSPTEKSFMLSENGVYAIKVDGGKIVANQVDTFLCESITSMGENLFAVSKSGVYKIGEKWVSDQLIDFREYPRLSKVRRFLSIACYADEVWLSSETNIFRFKKNEDTYELSVFNAQPNSNNSLKGNGFRNLMFDVKGNLWGNTTKHGLFYYDRSRNQFELNFLNSTDIQDLESDPVRTILMSSKGNLWVGFDRRGIAIQKNDGSLEFLSKFSVNTNNKRSIAHVRSIFEDSDSVIWVGTNATVVFYDNKESVLKGTSEKFGFSCNWRPYFIGEFESGKIIFAGSSNFAYYDKKKGELLKVIVRGAQEKQATTIRHIVRDSQKNYYLAYDNAGVAILDSSFSVLKWIDANSGLSDNKVYALELHAGKLWVATNNGLNVYCLEKNKIVKTIYEKDGLSNDIIYAVKADAGNNIWVSTNRGISRVSSTDYSIRSYLTNHFFLDDAFFYQSPGKFHYGGYSGIISFVPSHILDKRKPPPPMLRAFKINKHLVYPGQSNTIYNVQVAADSLMFKVKHTQNNFILQYHSIPVQYPNTRKFRYKMPGWVNGWYYANKYDNEIRFINVKPGNYALEVQVSDSDTEWSNSSYLFIEIAPPFWNTLVFKIGVVVLVLALFVLAYNVRSTQIKRRNKWLELKVDEQTADLKAKNIEIKSISEKLHQADQSKLRLFTNISHEFRTPLTLILGHLENENTLSAKNAMSAIHNNALRLLRLVNQIIDFRKVEHEQLKLAVSKFDVVPVLTEIVESFRVQAIKQDIELQFICETNLLEVWLDADKFDKIMFNLLSNAIKYTPRHKSVFVRLSESEKHIIIQVVDEGIGISEDNQSNIFNRFFRIDEGAEQIDGHGIGLAIVKGFADIQKATINLSSELNKGSCFELLFLKGKGHFSEQDFKRSAQSKFKEKLPRLNYQSKTTVSDKTILIVEDNEELIRYLSDRLKNNYHIIESRNGVEALEQVSRKLPDIILTDIAMPKMNGLEFCRQLKSNRQTASIPIIMLTAKAGVETRIEGFKLNIDGFLEKPFSMQELNARIEAVLFNRKVVRQELSLKKVFTPDSAKKLNQGQVEFWRTVQRVIAENYKDSEFNAERLCGLMNMSRSTLYRKFGAITTKNAADCIREYRLIKSAELIQLGKLNISQICQEIGYNSVNQFRNNFKDLFGVTPSKYKGSA